MAPSGPINVWFAFVVALAGRLLDVWSTFLVSPELKLEGNRLARRFGWKFVFGSIFLALLAFVSPFLGIVVGTMSFVMALSNMQTAPLVRHVGGEAEFAKLIFSGRAASSFNPWRSLLDIITITLPAFCIGGLLLYAVGVADDGIAGGVAFGLLTWGAGIVAHRTASLMRIVRRNRAAARRNLLAGS